jgi:hypothetical protein
MAGGTDGNIITYDTSGNPAVVTTGSSGQVLTSAGAGAAPTMAAGGAWEYIARQTLGSDASDIQFRDGIAATNGTPDFGSDYAQIMFVMEHFTPATNLAQSRLWISTDTGSSYLTTGYLSITFFMEGDTAGVNTEALKSVDAYRLGTTTHNDGALGLNGNVNLFNTSDTTRKPFATWAFCNVDNDGGMVKHYNGGAHHTTNQNVDAVKFGFSTGNVLAASEIRMYGLKAS